MKLGVRTPDPMKRLKARTTGKAKRQLKKAINPYYGMKGMGWIRDPKKAFYNKLYRKTTLSAEDAVKEMSGCLMWPVKLVCIPFIWMLKFLWFIVYITFKIVLYYPALLVVWIIGKIAGTKRLPDAENQTQEGDPDA